MKFKKVFKVLFVDFLSLLIGVINGFLLPDVFTKAAYAAAKTFTLYIGYSGVIHLGFSDGIYIILGGKKLKDVDKDKLRGYFNTLIKILVITTTLILLPLIVFRNKLYLYFVLYTIPFQIVLFVSLYLRATGSFDKYTLIRTANNVGSFLATIIVVFFYQSVDLYITIQVISQYIIAIVCMVVFLRNYKNSDKVGFEELKYLCKIGFPVLLGNLIASLVLSIDRWFVKFCFSENDFADYSFGVSMLNLFIALIASLTVVFYPYLANNFDDKKLINRIKAYLTHITVLSISGYFILDFIVTKYISKYISSLEILGILICCIPLITITNVIYGNLYKIKKITKRYTVVAFQILVLGAICNVILLLIMDKPVMVAYGTFITFFVWYFYSARDFEVIDIKVKEVLLIVFSLALFIGLKSLDANAILLFVVYVAIIFIIQITVFKEDIMDLKKLLLGGKHGI